MVGGVYLMQKWQILTFYLTPLGQHVLVRSHTSGRPSNQKLTQNKKCLEYNFRGVDFKQKNLKCKIFKDPPGILGVP
jgi:hypothetical protein